MNFQLDKSQLEIEFDVLKQQALSTAESWNDQIQRRFYEQFIDPLPKEFIAFVNAIDKLEKTCERAEQNIHNMQS